MTEPKKHKQAPRASVAVTLRDMPRIEEAKAKMEANVGCSLSYSQLFSALASMYLAKPEVKP